LDIYIDCEYNDFKGELISMALCAESGEEFYECVPCLNPSAWVAENVMPVIGKAPIDYATMQHKLAAYLGGFESIHIVADWPEDIGHFCDALIVGPGKRLDTPALTMEVIRISSESVVPHNALSDARAFRDEVMR
jgi:hypothetical protein